MSNRTRSTGRRLKQVVRERSFWLILGMLAVLTLLHYFRPQIISLPTGFLERHAVERIVFLLPVAAATFAFGLAGGLITLGLAALIMLPRILWLSSYQGDALLEMLAVLFVGGIVIWMIATQEREKRLRQDAVSRLRTINHIFTHVTRSLELEQILNSALDSILEVTGVEIGFVYLVDRGAEDLVLTVERGVPAELADEFRRIRMGETLCGRVAQTGKPLVVDDLLQEEGGTGLAIKAGMRSFAAVPLVARDRVMGVMDLADPKAARLSSQDVECLTSVGNAIGVAVENAYLYRSMRYYIQQITRAQEDERTRIARELHDDTIQSLIVLSRRLEGLAKEDERALPARAHQLHLLCRDADDVIQGIRRFNRDLRPSTLDDLGLVPTLEGLAVAMTEVDGIPTGLWVTGERRRLSPEVELALFRIAQEALNNVKKHAEATEVVINVEFTDGAVEMAVHDNGKGFILATPVEELAFSDHLGLIGMRERARLLGGALIIQSQPQLGTKVVVTVRDEPASPADRSADGLPPEGPPMNYVKA
jgi:signal transduction histidine kinase